MDLHIYTVTRRPGFPDYIVAVATINVHCPERDARLNDLRVAIPDVVGGYWHFEGVVKSHVTRGSPFVGFYLARRRQHRRLLRLYRLYGLGRELDRLGLPQDLLPAQPDPLEEVE